MKEINIEKILEKCPMGTKLYCTVYGTVYFRGITHFPHCYEFDVTQDTKYTIYCSFTPDGSPCLSFTKDGKIYADDGECILFPSKENRDWSKFKIEDSVNISERVTPIKFNKVLPR